MITLDEFVSKWNGKGIDFDGAYGDQCMDLMHQYCVEVLDLSNGRILAAPAAKDTFLNFNNVFGAEYFEKIDNTPEGVPQKGDIVFWGTGIGPYGHVAMFLEGNASKFTSFDQNFPTGSKCHIQAHTYKGVLGWLRAKNMTQNENQQALIDQLRTERDNNWNLYQEQVKSNETQTARIAELEGQVTKLKDENTQLTKDLTGAKQQIVDALSTAQKAHEEDLAALEQGLEAQRERDRFSLDLNVIRMSLKLPITSDSKEITNKIYELQQHKEAIEEAAINEYLYIRTKKLFTSFSAWLRIGWTVWRNKRKK